MCKTAEYIQATGEVLAEKTIVLTGALAPSRFRETDAIFNIGTAMGAVQSKPSGVYVCMHGNVFAAGSVHKNMQKRRFELK